jgi:hypothetical protein
MRNSRRQRDGEPAPFTGRALEADGAAHEADHRVNSRRQNDCLMPALPATAGGLSVVMDDEAVCRCRVGQRFPDVQIRVFQASIKRPSMALFDSAGRRCALKIGPVQVRLDDRAIHCCILQIGAC